MFGRFFSVFFLALDGVKFEVDSLRKVVESSGV